MEDSDILALYWQRSEQAIAETDRKYGAYCRQVAYQILRSDQDAEECVNDTWLKAWGSIPPQRPGILKAWLAKVTRNLSLDRWDKHRAEKRGGGRTTVLLSELSQCLPGGQTVDQVLEDRAISMAISAWLRTQNTRSRVIFVRRYFYADTLSQAARRVGISEAAAKSLLHRLRGSLRQYLEQEGIAV